MFRVDKIKFCVYSKNRNVHTFLLLLRESMKWLFGRIHISMALRFSLLNADSQWLVLNSQNKIENNDQAA